ncbi:hypothetical protein E3U23_11580 [Erythrobacter litoralis]|uniref:FAS1-like dehydratase domain-containing protein n=1 Tax=Erythrobacter litoralis TaxID=39960 RepID=UPI0024352183|nr:MaoC family dehydratase N-terminal domain-containing protein [Erythrobacter litoralis]MDG6079828.1 hypothetical protein [Erythrobacter litoralis]
MSEISEPQITEWKNAIGREVIEYQPLDKLALRRYSRAVGLTDEGHAPPLPHWAFFLPCPLDAEIGPDGHPRRGDFLPAITLPRRMFASASIKFEGPVETGLEGQLSSRVAEVNHKSGRSGDLVFVEVDRTLVQEGSVRVRERQTYVYRDWGDVLSMPETVTPAPDGEVWAPNEVNLFRFSAATFNGHRIHYDLPYTKEVEGYPALIVHGPFTAARLAGLAMRDGALAEFSFRAIAPIFLGQPIYLRKTTKNEVEAVRADGATAMQAKVTYQ